MRDNVLQRKLARLIILLADAKGIDEETAMNLFYSTEIYRQLSDPKYGLQLMSDGYLLDDILNELSDTGSSLTQTLSTLNSNTLNS